MGSFAVADNMIQIRKDKREEAMMKKRRCARTIRLRARMTSSRRARLTLIAVVSRRERA